MIKNIIKIFKNNEIKSRIFLFFMLAGFILIILVAIIFYFYSTNTLKNTFKNQSKEIINYYELRFDSFLKDEIRKLKMYHNFFGEDKLQEIIHILELDERYFDSYIFCKEGIIRYAKDPIILGYNYKNKNVYNLAINSKEPIFNTRFHPFENMLFIDFIIPVYNKYGEFLYGAVHQFKSEKLEKLLISEYSIDNGEIIFFDNSGIVFLQIKKHKIEKVNPISLFDYNISTDILFLDDYNTYYYEEKDYLITLKRMENNLGFLAKMTSYDLMNEELRNIHFLVISFSLIVIIFFAFLSLILAKRTIKPIIDLTERVKENYEKNNSYINISKRSELKILVDVLNKTWREKEIYQEKLIQEKNNAEQANRFKSQFLANMSHEIRTPMNGIIGMTNLALEKSNNEIINDYLSKILSSSNNLLNIINDILDLSKIESGQLKLNNDIFELDKLVKEIEEIFHYEKERKQINLILEVEENIPNYLYGDSLRIKQILINLIGNAIKFTKKGFVKVIIKKEKIYKEKIKLFFSIEDTGIGIKEENFNKLFKPFSQVDGNTTRNYGGTGLGLNITKKLVEKMEGKIWFESQFNKGSKFMFIIILDLVEDDLIKIYEKKLDLELKEKEIINTNKNTNNNILIVEDNKINQEIAKEVLEKYNYVVTLADNGLEALRIIEKNKFDLILMDIQMPYMDGYSTTEKIRKLNDETIKRIPIIAITANALKGDREKVIESGMDDYVSKPFNEEILINKINKWLNKQHIYIKEEEKKLYNSKIESIDYETGLKQLMGNEKLYLDVLVRFNEEIKNQIRNIHKNLDEKNIENIKKEIHSMKGISGNIGAFKLMKLCEKIEEKIYINEDFKEFIEYLDKEILEINKEINKLITQKNKEYTANKKILMDKQKILMIIDDINSKLEKNKLIDKNMLNNLRENISDDNLIDLYNLLMEKLDEFDYANSLNILNKIRKKIEEIN